MDSTRVGKALVVLTALVILLNIGELAPYASSYLNTAAVNSFLALDFDKVTGPVSRNPQKDILELSRAFGALYEVDSCSLAKSMNAVFGVETNFQQNRQGGSAYIGSFQQGIPYVQGAEKKLGDDLVRMSDLVQEGKINESVYTNMLAAARQGRALGADRGRLHHMYATLLALTEHVRMEKALQARTNNQLERAAAHVVFQFSPGNVRTAINSGVDRNSPWGLQNGISRGATVFEAIRLAGSGQYKGSSQIQRGVTSINCSTTAGYDSLSGFGSVSIPTDSLESTIGSSLISSFLGVPQTTQSPYCLTQAPSSNSLQNTIGSTLISSFLGVTPTQQNLGCLPQISSFGSGGNTASNSSSGGTSESSSVDSSKNDADGINKFSLNSAVDSLISAQSTTNTSIRNATPTLLCLPDPVNEGEDVIIMWACRDGAYKTQGGNFETGEKLIGSTTVSPSSDTTYTVTCINKEEVNNTSASCGIAVANPALALVTTPTSVKRGEKVSITWRTSDIKSCTLTSKNFPSFEKSGIEGEVVSPRLTAHTVFTLSCETVTGQLEEKKVSVFVQ